LWLTDAIITGTQLLADVTMAYFVSWQTGDPADFDYFTPGYTLGHLLTATGIQLYYVVLLIIDASPE
jgi:hypothetical protein